MCAYSLNVRTKGSGGEVARQIRCTYTEPTWSKAVILIHGFNRSWSGAKESYGEFLANTPLESFPVQLGPVFQCYWPGDEPNPVLSVVSYPLQIPKARESGERIAEFLRTRPTTGSKPLELIIICHSLGCRLTLEMVRCLEEVVKDGSVLIRRLILMAAAVPRGHVNGRETRLYPAVELSSRFRKPRNMYSAYDRVLHWAFPPGQIAGFDTGGEAVPCAVGRFGDPRWAWDLCDMGQFKYDHGYYWGKMPTAQKVAEYLGIPISRETDSVEAAVYSTPVAGPIASRELPVRTLGQGLA